MVVMGFRVRVWFHLLIHYTVEGGTGRNISTYYSKSNPIPNLTSKPNSDPRF